MGGTETLAADVRSRARTCARSQAMQTSASSVCLALIPRDLPSPATGHGSAWLFHLCGYRDISLGYMCEFLVSGDTFYSPDVGGCNFHRTPSYFY